MPNQTGMKTLLVGTGKSKREVFTNVYPIPAHLRKQLERDPNIVGCLDTTVMEDEPFDKYRRPATRKDWKVLHPMPRQRTTLTVERTFSHEEMERIKLGSVPVVMEHKWLIFYEQNRLYFHRSWTGFCIFIVEFEQRGDRFAMSRVQVSRHQKQYGGNDDAEDVELLLALIDHKLLFEVRPPNVTNKQKAVLARLAEGPLRVVEQVHWRTADSLMSKGLAEPDWDTDPPPLDWKYVTLHLSRYGREYLDQHQPRCNSCH
jgi:hypothetical protein